jgi:hypothetical protein
MNCTDPEVKRAFYTPREIILVRDVELTFSP